MQPMKILANWLQEHTSNNTYLLSTQDLRALFLSLSDNAYKTLLSRAVSIGHLERICRGIYKAKKSPSDGLLLFHAAAQLRPQAFNYISLETVLSDAGVISQIPINWIGIMSSGRSSTISCGRYGTIQFVHTAQSPQDLVSMLSYDDRCGMWRANVALALRDMKITRRNTDLIDWDIANEFI